MKRFRPIVMMGAILGAVLGFGPIEKGAVGSAVALSAQGCGPGFHRDVYGYCRPNAYGVPGVYRPYGAYGGRVYGGRVYGGRVYGGRVYGGRVSGGRPHVGHHYRGGYRGRR